MAVHYRRPQLVEAMQSSCFFSKLVRMSMSKMEFTIVRFMPLVGTDMRRLSEYF